MELKWDLSKFFFSCRTAGQRLVTGSLGMLFARLDGIPEPPSGYIPPQGASRNTWANIYKNKGRIDYCVQQFGVSPASIPVSCSMMRARLRADLLRPGAPRLCTNCQAGVVLRPWVDAQQRAHIRAPSRPHAVSTLRIC